MGNEEIVLAAVKQNGRALVYSSLKCRDHEEIVLAAVKQDGRALEYASDSVRNNELVVMTALKQCGSHAFRYASAEIKAKIEGEARTWGFSVDEYANGMAHPKIVQVSAP